jgi:hypothetical protein
MENIDKLFSQRFNEQKPENNYNSNMWNDFEKQLEQQMPAAKSKRKWWMGWRGLTILNTILLGSILAVLLYMNEGSKFKIQSSKAANELLITNYELQSSSAVEVQKEVSSSITADEWNKENVVLNSLNVKNEKNKVKGGDKLSNTINNVEPIIQAEVKNEETDLFYAENLDAIIEMPVQKVELQTHTQIPLKITRKPVRVATVQLPYSANRTKQKGPQYKLKLPEWLDLSSHPRRPKKGPRKEKPDIVPVPVEGF